MKKLAKTILTTDMFAWAREDVTRMLVIPTNMEIRADGNAVMGAGAALIARDRFKTYKVDTEYANMLRAWATSISGDATKVPTDLGLTQITNGQIFVSSKAPVVYFPTKTFWRQPSSMELIQTNLDLLADMARSHPDTTFAVPLLGAGNGQLPKEEVINAITEKLGGLENIQVFDYQSKTTAGASAGTAPVPGSVGTVANRSTDRVALADINLEIPAAPESIKELLANNKTLVVSGHRPDKLGGYSPQVRQHTRKIVGQILDTFKPTLVVAGGALGIDRAFMEMAEERGIKLLLADPCQGFAGRWNEQDQAKHEHLAAYARDTGAYVIVTDAPYKEAGGAVSLELRNRFMTSLLEHAAEGSKFAIIHDGTPGGTANCKAGFIKYYGQERARELYLGNFWSRFTNGHPLPGTLKAAQAATPAVAGATRLERPEVKVA